LKRRIQQKEVELIENEQRVMEMLKNKNSSIDEKFCNIRVKYGIDTSNMSSIASPYPSRKSMSLDGMSEVRSKNDKL
jgi:F420-0:gamma-glutamyl ligase